MVWAELRGVDLGIKRLTTLVRRIKAGGTRADSRRAVVKDLPSFAVLDGHDGWGQVTSVRAIRLAITKARTGGLAACVVRDTGTRWPWAITHGSRHGKGSSASRSPMPIRCRRRGGARRRSYATSFDTGNQSNGLRAVVLSASKLLP